MSNIQFWILLTGTCLLSLLWRRYFIYAPEPVNTVGELFGHFYEDLFSMVYHQSGVSTLLNCANISILPKDPPSITHETACLLKAEGGFQFSLKYYPEYILERIYTLSLYICQSYYMNDKTKIDFGWNAHGTSDLLGQYVTQFSCPGGHRTGYIAMHSLNRQQDNRELSFLSTKTNTTWIPATMLVIFRGSLSLQNVYDNIPSFQKQDHITWASTEPLPGIRIESINANSPFPSFPANASVYQGHYEAYGEFASGIHKAVIEAVKKYPMCRDLRSSHAHNSASDRRVHPTESDSTPLQCIDDVIISGHSLGGSFATFMALDLRVRLLPELERHKIVPMNTAKDLPVKVITFGQPKFGNLEMLQYVHSIFPHSDDIWRVTINSDPVPYIPTNSMDYFHIGREIHVIYQKFSHPSRYSDLFNTLSPFQSILDSFDIILCSFDGISYGAEDALCYNQKYWMDFNDHIILFNFTLIAPFAASIYTKYTKNE